MLFLVDRWHVTDSQPYPEAFGSMMRLHVVVQGALTNWLLFGMFFELWVKSFQDCYIPNENLTVDEQLVTFRGRCPFRQFIPSKPGKYGMKIWALCDSVTSYVYNMQVNTGREEEQNREVNQGQRVVFDLISGLDKSGRNVICDNFYEHKFGSRTC